MEKLASYYIFQIAISKATFIYLKDWIIKLYYNIII